MLEIVVRYTVKVIGCDEAMLARRDFRNVWLHGKIAWTG
jgi:hypothetical protein